MLLPPVGVEVDTIDDMHINVYASSSAALDDFKEKIDNILNSQTTVAQPHSPYPFCSLSVFLFNLE